MAWAIGKMRIERNCKMELEPGQLKISPMPKTWILDLYGTLLFHDGPYILGKDEFLTGAREFLDSIPKRDMIIFLTARSDYEKPHTMQFLKENNVRYDHIIFNAGEGERIMINDMAKHIFAQKPLPDVWVWLY